MPNQLPPIQLGPERYYLGPAIDWIITTELLYTSNIVEGHTRLFPPQNPHRRFVKIIKVVYYHGGRRRNRVHHTQIIWIEQHIVDHLRCHRRRLS